MGNNQYSELSMFKVDDTKLCVLFGSKTRVKLLRIFLNNPDEAYYVRELTRLTDSQINAIRRELSNLMQIGIIKLDTDKNKERELEDLKRGMVLRKGIGGVERKYYSLNKDFILHNELKNFFKKLFILSKEAFINRINTVGNISYLLLTGIFIGENNDTSVDILVVGDIDKIHLEKLISELGSGMGRDLNYTHMTAKEFLYRREVVDKFLYNILENKNNVILIDNLGKENEKFN